MEPREREEAYCTPAYAACCKVEALITIDNRGQMVLPKDLREKAHIRPGDKLAVTSWGENEKVSCIFLTRAEDLTEMVKKTLEPVLRNIS